ncbi:dTMP kinase [Candidatus Formimonas warabiya]|uniref:Thymidylate kinase n=1 Tax=Formimonas warabiya TaxID=1761012 RepID=A0A3G1KVQ5_FORW1|nr:thymidylate kinase [Candidatus Formimonas warabiya]ATW26459.1 thymidylate kinase [Candidatus Formimonas warabiya]
MTGKLIIIESGSDSSGKATQTDLLFRRLTGQGVVARKVEFPNYHSPASSLVKMYLNGDFGKNPSDVNPYVASTFYAVDRFASFRTAWQEFYLQGGLVLADRYTTSNMVHQGAKLNGREKDRYLDWLWDLEFNIYQLPVPDGVIFLDVPVEFSCKLMAERDNKFNGTKEKDIHERNKEYLARSYENARYIAQKYGWMIIHCVKGGSLRTIEEIHEEIYGRVEKILRDSSI